MSFEKKSAIFKVSKEQASLRIDKLLSLQFPSHSRSYFQYLIEKGSVLLNGKESKKRISPIENDEIEVFFTPLPDSPLTPEDIPLTILYEDEDLLAINKPPGMVVHPAPGNPNGTFVNALLHHCSSLPFSEDKTRPGIVHRLDKETSGILLAAKNSFSHQSLVSLFSERKVEKEYLALCLGHPKEGRLDAPLGRHPIHRKKMAILPDKGKPASTDISILSSYQDYTLIQAKPITGRTHQIRVHLRFLKAPILGDSLYGSTKINKELLITRQYLHAYRLHLPHPITKKRLSFQAPIPEDMESFMKKNNLSLPSL